MQYIWVVELLDDSLVRPKWEPTLSVALTRKGGMKVMRWWQRLNPGDKFRLRKYVRNER